MLVLGHAGITLGVAVLISGAANTTCSRLSMREQATALPPKNLPNHSSSWLTYLAERIDIRLLLVASLLPDIIDKPLGYLFFRESISNGRTIGHTFLFLIIITLAGFLLYYYSKRTWLLVISFGIFIHLVLDQMWMTPKTLLWPLLGFTFEKHDISNYIPGLIDSLTTKPQVYVPEIAGGLILLWFAWEIIKRRRLLFFVRHGRI